MRPDQLNPCSSRHNASLSSRSLPAAHRNAHANFLSVSLHLPGSKLPPTQKHLRELALCGVCEQKEEARLARSHDRPGKLNPNQSVTAQIGSFPCDLSCRRPSLKKKHTQKNKRSSYSLNDYIQQQPRATFSWSRRELLKVQELFLNPSLTLCTHQPPFVWGLTKQASHFLELKGQNA